MVPFESLDPSFDVFLMFCVKISRPTWVTCSGRLFKSPRGPGAYFLSISSDFQTVLSGEEECVPQRASKNKNKQPFCEDTPHSQIYGGHNGNEKIKKQSSTSARVHNLPNILVFDKFDVSKRVRCYSRGWSGWNDDQSLWAPAAAPAK